MCVCVDVVSLSIEDLFWHNAVLMETVFVTSWLGRAAVWTDVRFRRRIRPRTLNESQCIVLDCDCAAGIWIWLLSFDVFPTNCSFICGLQPLSDLSCTRPHSCTNILAMEVKQQPPNIIFSSQLLPSRCPWTREQSFNNTQYYHVPPILPLPWGFWPVQ